MAEQWRLLVVEGEESLNVNIVNSLQKDAYVVQRVKSETEAIRLLWSEEYDLVICSQQMTGTNGIDLLQWMRTYCPNTRMVMLASPGASVTRSQALEMGVASYLEMPLDLHMLKEELRRLLHQTGFSASLDSFDLLDVIQIITMSQKSIALVISTGLEEQGVLRFQSGELIWAEYGMLRGEEAFFALAAHKNGTVIHRPWNEQIMPNVTQPLSRLIFQALQYRSKYADVRQLSSEMEPIRSHDPFNLLPPTTMPDVFQALGDDEEDDSPFQFVEEDISPVEVSSDKAFEQFIGNGSTINSTWEQLEGMVGMLNENGQKGPGQAEAEEKEWWEPTGTFPRIQGSVDMYINRSRELEQSVLSNGINITPSTVHKTVAAQNNPLPSWLTDQPTDRDLPVLRDNTGQLSTLSQERSPAPALPAASATPLPTLSAAPPVTPPLPNLSQSLEAGWSAPNGSAAFQPPDTGLRKIKLEDTADSGPQRIVSPTNHHLTTPLRLSPVEGELPRQTPHEQSEPVGAVKPFKRAEQVGRTLQSLVTLKRTTASLVNGKRTTTGGPATLETAAQDVAERNMSKVTGGKPARRNYAALAAALQTLGYSVAGFVASAVVGLDGTPIAQVAVDELDISPMCGPLSMIMQGTAQALEAGHWEGYEHTIITRDTQYILLRLVGNKKDAFQVLITTRETSPAESLEVMANVEAAIAAALY